MFVTWSHAPAKPSGAARSDNTPTAPWSITCGTNLCASNKVPDTAANNAPLPVRRESWLTSVTTRVSSPVSFASVSSAIRLVVAIQEGLLYHHRGNILIAHQLIECGHV